MNTVRTITLKLLIAVTAFTALVGSPALARVQQNVPPQSQPAQSQDPGFFGIRPLHPPAGTNPAYAVYGAGGHYIGSDPDPRVRQQMLSDSYLGY
jgi:hypothetical protein